jgi:hypothetical protein
MSRRMIFGCAMLACTATPVWSAPNDHFRPATSVWSDDRWESASIAKVVFKPAFADDVVLRLDTAMSMVLSDFTETMIALRKLPNARYAILTLHTDKSLGLYTPGARQSFGSADLKPRDYRDIHPTRCDAPLATPLAQRIVAVWRAVLLETHYDADPVHGMDGANFDAWMRDEHAGQLAGFAWSPDSNSHPGLLIDIAAAMEDYCARPNARLLAVLDQRTAALERSLHGTRR